MTANLLVDQDARMDGDVLFARLRAEAEAAVRREPELGALIQGAVLAQDSLESALAHRLAQRLERAGAPYAVVFRSFEECFSGDAALKRALRMDLLAVLDRDPACRRALEPVLYFKGFHAVETYRLVHALWSGGRSDLALYLQSLSARVFQTDIHPAAQIGGGFFLDHATGVVIGATAVVEENVSMLHAVTLGGSGRREGERHPKVRRDVLIGAGAQIFGNIEIGAGALVAAGSVVVDDVPAQKIVAGVPARVVGEAGAPAPGSAMEQVRAFVEAGI